MAAKVGCPPSTPNNETSVITKVGGLQRAPTVFFESVTRVRFCKTWSFLGQLPHFSGSKLCPFQF